MYLSSSSDAIERLVIQARDHKEVIAKGDKVGSLKVVEEVALDKVTAMDKVVVRVGNRDIRIIRQEA
jgi:hypothetical protein